VHLVGGGADHRRPRVEYSATKAAVKMMVRAGPRARPVRHQRELDRPRLIDTPLARFQAGREGGDLRASWSGAGPSGGSARRGIAAWWPSCAAPTPATSPARTSSSTADRATRTRRPPSEEARQERRALAEAAERPDDPGPDGWPEL
jgi:hypothetical protein